MEEIIIASILLCKLIIIDIHQSNDDFRCAFPLWSFTILNVSRQCIDRSCLSIQWFGSLELTGRSVQVEEFGCFTRQVEFHFYVRPFISVSSPYPDDERARSCRFGNQLVITVLRADGRVIVIIQDVNSHVSSGREKTISGQHL